MRTAIVLTAISVETKSVLLHLSDVKEERVRSTVFHVGCFLGKQSSWRVAVAELGPGNISAAVIAERATSHFSPDVALFVGVAGGLKDVTIGDVVVGTKLYGYESGKVEDNSFRARPNVGRSSEALVQRARAVAHGDEWQSRLNDSLRSDSRKIIIGPIAAGEKVIASIESDLYRFLRSQYNDAIAVEMEGYGFLEALANAEEARGLVVRGISDLLSNKAESDSKGSQDIAAASAAAVAFEILSRFDTTSEQSTKAGVTKAGDVSLEGTYQAGDGRIGKGGSVKVKAGDGYGGVSGGSITLGPGTYKAGNGGEGGDGGDIVIKAGDALP